MTKISEEKNVRVKNNNQNSQKYKGVYTAYKCF